MITGEALINDNQFEAAFLLVGLVDEREVPAWATERAGSSAEVGRGSPTCFSLQQS